VSFKGVFIAVFLGTALVVAALLVNARRPAVERSQPTGALIAATGRCAQCHRRETAAVVHEYEGSRHAAAGVNCLDCHRPSEGQPSVAHRGFTIAKTLTSKNCAQCHAGEYQQFARSRHAGPSWAAVGGTDDFSPAQIAEGERHHPGWIQRPANALVALEGDAAVVRGCDTCHGIGRPNEDGSFGTCTHCHARHAASVALAREPTTCGQCHMGPDHSQIEIYQESKHGALFAAQRGQMDLSVAPSKLTTRDMPVPTCATCHMSGIDDLKVSHDTTERLSWFLFAPVSTRRPGGQRGQTEMKEVCTKCHATSHIDRFFTEAEAVLVATNDKVQRAIGVVAALRAEGYLTPERFDEEIEFVEFDLWHYFGRTAKHGAFMGGADFVQWHGNYELLRLGTEIDHIAATLRAHPPGHVAAPSAGPAPTAPAPPSR
jgi:hydroxylamine dehydrogenase